MNRSWALRVPDHDPGSEVVEQRNDAQVAQVAAMQPQRVPHRQTEDAGVGAVKLFRGRPPRVRRDLQQDIEAIRDELCEVLNHSDRTDLTKAAFRPGVVGVEVSNALSDGQDQLGVGVNGEGRAIDLGRRPVHDSLRPKKTNVELLELVLGGVGFLHAPVGDQGDQL